MPLALSLYIIFIMMVNNSNSEQQPCVYEFILSVAIGYLYNVIFLGDGSRWYIPVISLEQQIISIKTSRKGAYIRLMSANMPHIMLRVPSGEYLSLLRRCVHTRSFDPRCPTRSTGCLLLGYRFPMKNISHAYHR